MKNVITLAKPLGMTPLQAIHTFKEQYPEYLDTKIGYAGRLDPLAEGLLLLLIGEENNRKKDYENLPKTYEFDVLFGVSTDTYDTLGLITSKYPQSSLPSLIILTNKIAKLLPSYLGTQNQLYPPYSSRTVDGKPLYWYARNNLLKTITIPTREVEIYSLELLSSTLLLSKKCEQEIMRRVQIVSGDFRQDTISSSWHDYFAKNHLPLFPVFSFRMTCSSGTYVRSLAQRIGDDLAIPALAYSIRRTTVGDYSLADATILDL